MPTLQTSFELIVLGEEVGYTIVRRIDLEVTRLRPSTRIFETGC